MLTCLFVSFGLMSCKSELPQVSDPQPASANIGQALPQATIDPAQYNNDLALPPPADNPAIINNPDSSYLAEHKQLVDSQIQYINSVVPTNSRPATAPIVAMFGGWNTCGKSSGLYYHSALGSSNRMQAEALVDYLRRLYPGQNVPLIRTCYMQQKWLDGHRARLISSDNPTEVQFLDSQGVANSIASAARANGNRNVIMIGHSMGGTLAMQVAGVLSPEVKINSLITLDPISHYDCNYIFIINSVLDNLIPTKGCTILPSEVTSQVRAQIRGRVQSDGGSWANIFQTDFSLLHSIAVPEANLNKRLQFSSGLAASLYSHNKVNSSQATWQIISAFTGLAGFVAPGINE